MNRLPLSTSFGVLVLLACAASTAATVYRWVDEQGKVHYSGVVPERYRSAAKPVNASANEPTAEQQREALGRAQKEKDKAEAIGTQREGSAPNVRPPPAAARPTGKRPSQIPNDQTDCETWQRLYMESLDCFGPYRTVRGGIKPEAFELCNVVPEPPPSRCRMRTPQGR